MARFAEAFAGQVTARRSSVGMNSGFRRNETAGAVVPRCGCRCAAIDGRRHKCQKIDDSGRMIGRLSHRIVRSGLAQACAATPTNPRTITMPNRQSGFTLVEIAIVLVIIGLLLGGVLKGQELINSAKVKNFAQDFRSVPLFIYGYQDKFKALPGDDLQGPTSRVGGILQPTDKGQRCNRTAHGNSTTVTRRDGAFLAARTSCQSGIWFNRFHQYSRRDPCLPTRTAEESESKRHTADHGNDRNLLMFARRAFRASSRSNSTSTMDDGDTTTGSMRVGTSGKITLTRLPSTGTGAIIDDGQPIRVCLGF